jgi:predicted GTPase
MGYWPEQLRDLEATMERVPCELVLSATPIDLGALVRSSRPIRRVSYAIEEIDGNRLREALLTLVGGAPDRQ